MNINILEIIILVVTAAFALSGFRKGFVRKLASMLSLVLSIVLVSAFLPYVTDFLKDSTPVYEYIVKQSEKMVTEQVEELFSKGQDAGTDETQQDSTGGTGLGSMYTAGMNISRVDQMEIIERLPVPQMLKDMLLDYNNADGYASLHVQSFQEYVAHFAATLILNAVSFIVAVILVQLILHAVIAALDILAHIPVIRVVNRLAGLLLGLVEALFFIWIFFLILSMLSGTQAGLYLLGLVQESELLCQLYDSNVFLQIVLHATALFI